MESCTHTLQRSAAWAAEAFRLLFMTSSSCCCCATSRRYRFTFQGQRWEAVIVDNEFVYATIGNCATEESVTRQALDWTERCIFIYHTFSFLSPALLSTFPSSPLPESNYHSHLLVPLLTFTSPRISLSLSANSNHTIYAVFFSLFDSRHRSCLRANEAEHPFTQKGSN